MKIKASWLNNYSKKIFESVSTITLVPGNYSIATVQAAICDQMDLYDEDGNLLGFGNSSTYLSTSGESLYTYPGFAIDGIQGKMRVQQFPNLLKQVFNGKINTHQYRSFELVYDSDTKGLLQLLGFIQNNSNPTNPPFQDFTINCYINTTSYNSTSDQTTVTYYCESVQSDNSNSAYPSDESSDPPYAACDCIARFAYDMQPIKSLYFGVEGIGAKTRAPWGGVLSSIIARIPVYASSGGPIDYTPPYLYEAKYKANNQISSLSISIRDEENNTVDFNGINWSADILFCFYEQEDTTENTTLYSTGAKRKA